MAMLEDTIQKQVQQAMLAAPPGDHDRPIYLSRLAQQLYRKYAASKATAYLDQSIKLLQQAIETAPLNHLNRPRILHILSFQFHERYLRTKDFPDLENSVLIARDVIDSVSDDDPLLATMFSTLGITLKDRYSAKGIKWDLDEAIDCSRRAVAAVADDDPTRARYLDTLGIHLGYQHWRGGIGSNPELKSSSEEAIAVSREAVRLTPQGHPESAGRWKNLGTHLGHRYHSGQTADGLEESIQCHISALHSKYSPPLRRIQAARDVLPHFADISDWDRAFVVVTEAISLVPKMIFRSSQHSDKLYVLSQLSGLASDAAAVALNAGKDLSAALRLLEMGRGVLTQSMEEMRTDRASLQVHHPELAKSLSQIRSALDDPLQYDKISEDPESSWLEHSRQQEQADEQLANLLGEIRKQPGFEDYLTPPSEADIEEAAKKGPVVVINMSQFRCDAIIVEPHQLRLLTLPKLSLADVEDLYSLSTSGPMPVGTKAPVDDSFNIWEAVVTSHEWDDQPNKREWGNLNKEPQAALGSPKVLKWLWEAVANPVMDGLGLTHKPMDDNWPHVWWIPTGSLSKFPIHAAGNYYPGTAETVLDRCVSSYSSSIKSLLKGRLHQLSVSGSSHALLVGMETTQGLHSPLPFARREVELVKTVCSSMGVTPIEPQRRKQAVVSNLAKCTIFHFAGHGESKSKDPLNSQLLLDDWKSDPFTVTSLLDTKLHDNSPFLAYLSACGTGRIDEERYSDESIHLISACQLAGFRHVVGTLWEVNDESCVDVARITYEMIRDEGLKDKSVSRGLHAASLYLRDMWSKRLSNNRTSRKEDALRTSDRLFTSRKFNGQDSEKDIGRDVVFCDDDDDDNENEDMWPLYWVPYVHFGV
ncbi:CHAT domain-containing protein [Fusarium avenaceum]|nr:CHAT domain-containing protein [Fusarium avenaceum]